jgi:glucokinase
MRILAGDVGGTKTLLAVFEDRGDRLAPVREARFSSRDEPSLEAIVEKFMAAAPRDPIDVGCFAVAGPVVGGKVTATNLPWTMEESSLARASGATRVRLLNDLEGTAYGMLFLPPEKRHVLHAGSRPLLAGNVAVIAAGTGLGEAMLWHDGSLHHPIASEGGHADFGPKSDEEIELLRHLRSRFGAHVSYERILAGPGLYNVYGFLRDSGFAKEPAELADALAKAADPSPLVSERGLARSDANCTRALEIFCRIYGAEAGNLALRFLAVGGVFLGGGIAPKILPALASGGFVEGYTDKGRFSPFVSSIPVHVSLEPRTALLGAAHYALRLARSKPGS